MATQLRKYVNKLFRENPYSKIVVTGDFNDETDNDSVLSVLDAKPSGGKMANDKLYNCSAALDLEEKGTYNYKGKWNMLDQFIVSGNLLNKTANIQISEARILQAEWLFYKDKKYGHRPNATYGGPNYYGGFSDHLPIYVEVRK